MGSTYSTPVTYHWVVRIYALLLLLVTATFCFGQSFTTQSFDTEIVIGKDRSLDITEQVGITYKVERPGWARGIPLAAKTKDGRLRYVDLEVLDGTQDGAPAKLTIERKGGDISIRFGKNGPMLTGSHVYQIHYRVKGAITDFLEDTGSQGKHHELFWNVVPTKWSSPIESAKFRVRFPETTGNLAALVNYGPPSNSQHLRLNSIGNAEQGGVSASLSNQELSGAFPNGMGMGEGASVVLGLPLGLLQPPPQGSEPNGALITTPGGSIPKANPIVGALGLLGFPALFLAFFRKSLRWPVRNHPVNFEGPSEIGILECSRLISPTLRSRAFVAGTVDLAQNGYCKLVNNGGEGFSIEITDDESLLYKKGFGARLDALKKLSLPDYPSVVADFAVQARPTGSRGRLLDGLSMCGKNIDPATLKEYFPPIFRGIHKGVEEDMTTAGFIKGDFRPFFRVLSLFGVCFLGSFAQEFGAVAAAGVTLGCLTVFVLSLFMTNDTPKGADALNKLYGIKKFIESPTERRNLIHFANTNLDQALYERLLPYAILLGVVDKWNKAFEGMNLAQPDWYQNDGYSDGWMNSFYYDTHHFESQAQSLDSSPYVPSSGNSFDSGGGWGSGDSGFDGGGGSGDGGGGGGGGD